jgi:hypothetical protein
VNGKCSITWSIDSYVDGNFRVASPPVLWTAGVTCTGECRGFGSKPGGTPKPVTELLGSAGSELISEWLGSPFELASSRFLFFPDSADTRLPGSVFTFVS